MAKVLVGADGSIDVRTHKKALNYLARKFRLRKSAFEFSDVWIECPWINCVLYNIVDKNSRLYGSTVGYELQS